MSILHFNPRPREEGDPAFTDCFSSAMISIHALVKRATVFHCLYYTAPLYFNPRPREEGDASSVGYNPQSDDFNPRPREEGDLVAQNMEVYKFYFNPRPREEGDSVICRI